MEKKVTVLSIKMLQKIPSLINVFLPEHIDLTDLDSYVDKQITVSSGVIDCKQLGSDFLYAKDIALRNAKVCEAFYLHAETLLKKEEALAYLVRAKEMFGVEKFSKEGVRTVEITDGKASEYVSQDNEVLRLRNLKNSWYILSKYFIELSVQFDKKHDWAKKILDAELRMDPSQLQG